MFPKLVFQETVPLSNTVEDGGEELEGEKDLGVKQTWRTLT